MNLGTIFQGYSGFLALLITLASYTGCIYGAFKQAGLGTAILVALLGAPVSFFMSIMTKYVLEKAVFIVAKISLANCLLMIVLVPIHIFTCFVVPSEALVSKLYGNNVLEWASVFIVLTPFTLLMSCGMCYLVDKIAWTIALSLRSLLPP